ncbi:MAG: GlsB/YeaQ/YmgE family stress response membrane protein [Rhodoferax sp.]
MAESCQYRTIFQFQESGINPYIWCLVGAAVGWLAALMMGNAGKTVMIENVLVGVFGAFIGGDFIASQLNGGVVNDTDFRIGSLGLAVGGAVVMLVLLRLMRRVVGPMRAHKTPNRRRD